ncbi:hypothetical protein [Streptosporangium sp. NPDC020145]|uniref:zinc finger domain-containing protein n=1 Tax=Streptosporangium sp. NPDC020145 TaxID=3154694 RepID=UPI0034292BDE
MTPEETIDLLSLAASFDRRTVGRADVMAWHAAVGDLDFADARDAVVAHYRDNREWIMPADVRKRVKAVREERLARQPVPAPPAENYRAGLRAAIDQIAGGRSVQHALGRSAPTPPNAEYLAERADPHRELRVAVAPMACPRCGAVPGARCVDAFGGPLTTVPAHDARLVAAGLAEWTEVNGQRQAVLIDGSKP